MSFFDNYFKPHGQVRSGDDAIGRRELVLGWQRREQHDDPEPMPERAERAPTTDDSFNSDTLSSPPPTFVRGSIYPHGDYRDGRTVDDLIDIKCDVMVNWLQQQQLENMWTSHGPSEGVVLKKRVGEFVACPTFLAAEHGGLFDQIKALNVKCAMTVKTRIVQLFLDRTQTDSIPLMGNLRLQILSSIKDLPRCQKHHFAAFIRDTSFLLVWQDDPKMLLEKVRSIEKQLMEVIWNSDEDPESVTSTRVIGVGVNTMSVDITELEDGLEAPRQVKLQQAVMVALTLVLSIMALGAGWRQIAIETSVDHSLLRLVLASCIPFQLWLAQFFMQSVVGSLCQCLGPVQQLKQNSRYFSAKAQPRILRGSLPHVTIQCPVYKESLKTVIGPTIRSIKSAISTYELQGGTANIFVNDDGIQVIGEEKARERREFYDEHNIGWIARPKDKKVLADSTVFHRAGKFKKASNMNHALAVSARVEDKLAGIHRLPDWNSDQERQMYKLCLESILMEDNGETLADGDIRIGDYILLVDSDTEVPEDCFFDACNEMERSPQTAIIQFRSGVMNVTTSYFERGITFFTNLIYTAIAFAVASGDVAPFVGHNAMLRWSALQDVAYQNEGELEKYWSETTVSEDFDMALRLQSKGYHIRYADYFGEGFKEGVSLTVYDELLRWEKYAFGCAELIFHPMVQWPTRGPLTPLFRTFLMSNIPLPSKVTILAYVGTYYAIGSAWVLTIMNYVVVGWYNTLLDHYYIDSFRIFFSIIVVFTALGNFALATLRYRQGSHNLLLALWENVKWIPLLAVFLGGVSMHVSWAIVSHLISLDMQWGSTAKELASTTLAKELQVVWFKFRKMLCFCFFMFAVVAVMAVAVPPFWQINTLIAIFPLCNVLVSHVLLPLALNPGMMLFSF